MYDEHVHPVYREENGIGLPFQTVKLPRENPKKRLVSKISIIEKNWPLYALDGELDADPVTIVWHRDVVAGKCILIKGKIAYT